MADLHEASRRWMKILGTMMPLLGISVALPAAAQDGIAGGTVSALVGSVSATIGQKEVVVPISATTTENLTGLTLDVTFDPQLCGLIENQMLRRAGRTTAPVQEGGVRCPAEGRISVVLIDFTGNVVVPPGDGVIAEWVFDVRSDAAVGAFPLDLEVLQARDGPRDVPVAEQTGGQLEIEEAPTATPTSTPTDTPVLTATPSATPTATSSATASATPTATASATPTATVTTTATATVSPSATVEPTSTPTPTVASTCPGDCNGDFVVSIDELVLSVEIALGHQPPAECEALGDGVVAINDLVAAVGAALNGCPAAR